MSQPIRFALKTDLRAGPGASSVAAEHARERSCRRVAVILDAGLRDNPRAADLVSELESAAESLQLLHNDVSEPDYEYLDSFRHRLDPALDLIVAAGGGSTLDLAKATSVLVTNPRPAISYRGFDLIEQPGIPLIVLPTTAGTGSEVTPNAVFTDRSEMRKLGINTELYLPRLALLDPLLTLSCPRSVTVSAGADALVHAVESYVAAAATPISHVYSREAFRLLVRDLPAVVERPDDVAVRLRLQLAAFYAGAALMNAGAGPAGALSYPLGVRFDVPHGLAGGTFIGPVARWNVERGATRYAGLADLLADPPVAGASEIERSRAVADAIAELTRRLGVPTALAGFGVGPDDVPTLVEETFLLEGALLQNPVEIDREGLREIVEGMLCQRQEVDL